MEPTVIELGRRDLLVVAGMPGAGKTTMLRRAAGALPVLDSDQVRVRLADLLPGAVPYRWYRPVVHLCHRVRIVARAVGTRGPLVVHEPATRASTRRWLAAVASATGRPARLLWLDVTAEEALAGQHSRGRLVRSRSFARHATRAARMRAVLASGTCPAGWRSVQVLDRPAARRAVLVFSAGPARTSMAPTDSGARNVPG